jgi:hypothetical protein
MAYITWQFGLIDRSDFLRRAVELGYNVHGGDSETGYARIPDLTGFMPEIADDFSKYLRNFLPEVFYVEGADE